jgi:Rieske Fe-S protein
LEDPKANLNTEAPGGLGTSRRTFLKALAAAPMAIVFALLVSPLLRYFKPTMKPLNFFQPADIPEPLESVQFKLVDFPTLWTCIPFTFRIKAVEFNPEQQIIRQIPAFIIRIAENEFVAFSRICPKQGCILNYLEYDPNFNCGCGSLAERCCCAVAMPGNPVLFCPCDMSMYDVARGARVLRGSAPRPPRQFRLRIDGDNIVVVELEFGGLM